MTSLFLALTRPRTLALALAVSMAHLPAVEAQSRRPTVIRDTEIEAVLRGYAQPIFNAAGIGSGGADIIIVQDSDFNAFVASGRRMFVFTGLLAAANTPNEVIGVLAHEAGHLAGGHLENLRNEIARAQAVGTIVALLGAAGAAVGMAAGSSAGARIGGAAASMAPNMMLRSVLSYKRAQELAADRAALSYLNAAGQSARGMVETFRRFADQQLFSAQYADPYAQSHPMARDRLDQLERAAQQSPYWDAADSPDVQLRHDMMRAKLAGFIESPGMVERRYPRSDKSLPARYARAIAASRSGSTRAAVPLVQELIAYAPNYPYFHELKGQILLEAGRAKEAVAPLQKAVSIAPKAGLIRILLGHALLETGDDRLLGDAVAHLRAGLQLEKLASIGYRHLAAALQRQGKTADAEVATAEALLIEGDIESAQNFAHRAAAKLARGSPGWLKAQDIINYDPPRGSREP
jgi:predicted Zn-dependent protease